MRIAIIADDIVKEGGSKEVIKHIMRALDDDHELYIEYVNSEKYFPRYLPSKWKDLFRIFYLGRISNTDNFSQFDVIITLQPDSHCLSHRNHIVYFQHHIKQYYDLFWQSFREKKRLKKKIVFLLLTAIARLADKIYLTPNLKKAHVIVNSQTVGKRLKKYNQISNFSVINPGCNNTIVAPPPSNDQRTTLNINSNNNNLQKKNEPYLLLAFSRLNVMQKGIDVILETASMMPHNAFVIAGPYDTTIESIDKGHLPANVQLIVREFSDEEKAELFNRCDVFLAPYIKEDFGITPLEANAYGKPVVYCDDSGEITFTQRHKETGFMCKRLPQAMVEGIQYCITNKEHMKMICIANAAKYSWQKFEKSFLSYINNLKIH